MTIAAVSTDLFLSGVIGLMRLSDASREAYRIWRARKDVHVLPDSLEGMTETFSEVWALRHLRVSPDPEIRLLRDTEYRDLFANPDFPNDLTIRPDCAAMKIEALSRVREILLAGETCVVNGKHCPLDEMIGVPCGENGQAPVRMSRMLILQHELWEREPQAYWAPFARALVQTTVDVVQMYPGAMGLSSKAEKILVGMAPTIDSILQMSWEDPNARSATGVVDAFLAGALEVAATYPELVTSERDLKPLVTGILSPLAEEAKADGGLRRLRAKRMRDFFAGPLAHGVLRAVSENADLYLKGEFAADELGGVVARATLADFVTADPGQFSLRDMMSEKGGLVLYNKMLATVAEQPSLVLSDKGEVSDAIRGFLKASAVQLKDAPMPYNWRSDLGAELLSSAFDTGGMIATMRLSRRIGRDMRDSDWSVTSKEFATSIIGGFVDGLKAEYLEGAGNGGKPRFENVIESMFTREQAVDLFKIVANTVAADPAVVLPGHANDQMIAVTRVMAAAIGSDTSGLLGSEDWRAILSAGFAQAAKNPSTLLSMDENDPEQQIICVLISNLMGAASVNMNAEASKPGRIMFGETLREAVVATLSAATTSVRGALTPRDGGASALQEYLTMLDGFLSEEGETVLLAPGVERQVRLSADDWLRVFKHFIVQVLETPPDAGPEARVSREDVARLLHDIEPVVVSAPAEVASSPAPAAPPVAPVSTARRPRQMEEVG